MMDGIAALGVIAKERSDEIVITHMTTGHDWSKVSTRPELDLHLAGAMGKASSFGLGIALARPDQRVWVLDGDGSLLMNLGSLVTVANMAPKNLVHFVYENDAYDTTGGQTVPGAGRFDLAAIGRGSGYPRADTFDNLEDLLNRVREVVSGPGPTLVVLKVLSRGVRGPAGIPRTLESYARLKQILAQRPLS